jgi:hypothetical protein
MNRFSIILLAVLSILSAHSCFPKKNTATSILVIASHENFGSYAAEILKTEGFNEFVVEAPDSEKISYNYLKQFDIVILAEGVTDPGTIPSIEKYVRSGGNIIAFRPDSSLSGLLGIQYTSENLSEGYIAIDTALRQGKGLTSKPMQFHGTADICHVNSGHTIAEFFANKTARESYPAVVANDPGNGHTIAFLYNLPKSIVYTRQGNPLFAGIEKDSIPGLRGMDLFTDGWVDTITNTINQADQQMALLTNCIQNLSMYSKPLPRFWYFPDSLKCLAVLDNDGEYNNEVDFEPQFRDVDSMGAKMTIYLIGVDKVSKSWVEKWIAKGFEIAGHPDDTWEAGNPHWNSMDSAIKEIKSAILSKYDLPIRTNVNHWFVWCGNDENGQQDFGAQARLEEKNGIEMDANYAIYDINSNQPKNFLGTPGYNQGNYIGSGLVMKYADVSGHTINVYQRFNAVYDQQYNEGSTADEFFNCFKGLVDRSLNEDIYSFVSIKAHNNEYYFSKEPLMRMLDYANVNGVPVWTAVHLLDFLKMKDEASFSNLSWRENKLGFTIHSTLKHSNGLTFMIPADHQGMKVREITIDGTNKSFDVKTVKGTDHAFVTIEGGNIYEISAKYDL